MLPLRQFIDGFEPVECDGRSICRVQELKNLVVYEGIPERYLTIESLQDLIIIEGATLINVHIKAR